MGFGQMMTWMLTLSKGKRIRLLDDPYSKVVEEESWASVEETWAPAEAAWDPAWASGAGGAARGCLGIRS